MRPKRSKQYKKLVQQFQLHHGFREPYQVLVDADLVRDSQRFTMDLQARLESTLHGKVKIMITQCCIRHLYAQAQAASAASAAKAAQTTGGGPPDRAERALVEKAIALAKTFERRRCGHRPEEFAEPLSTQACLGHVVDEKGRGVNKHRYVIASQDAAVRRHMRGIAGVPLIYITRSVMIMEPMSHATAKVGSQAERAKFRSELRGAAGEKRKREEEEEDADSDDGDDGGNGNGNSDGDDDDGDDGDDSDDNRGGSRPRRPDAPKPSDKPDAPPKKKKKNYGPKQPNPLSVKKKKAAAPAPAAKKDEAPKKKRIRKHKKTAEANPSQADGAAVEAAVGGV